MVAAEGQQGNQSKGFVPVPDPTILTTEQLLREIGGVREFVLGEIGHIGTTTEIRFKAVEKEFDGVARRTAEQKTDTKDALDAALAAQKEAVALQTEASDKAIAKSEAATTKQIDALAVQVDKSSDAKDEKIEDLKARMDKLEGSVRAMILMLTLLVSVASVAVGLYASSR